MTTADTVRDIARDTSLTPSARLLLIAAIHNGPGVYLPESTWAGLTSSTPHQARAHLVELRKAGYIARQYVDAAGRPIAVYATTLPEVTP